MFSLMDNGSKTKTQLLAEVAALRQQPAMLRTAQIDAGSSEWFAMSGLKILREYERALIQILAEVATENNSTTLFPVPIDLLSPFLYRT